MSAILDRVDTAEDAKAHGDWIASVFLHALRRGNLTPSYGPNKALTAFDILMSDLVGTEEKLFAEAVSKIVCHDYESGCASFLRFVGAAVERVRMQAVEARELAS